MHVIGTAGHVDHGKSSLVRALTGTDPDRWIEERLRGMTLDLGFAHLVYDDGTEAGIVDVPGHERFLHNMLAGAAGMELLLLVIAANEGVRPQTREHLAILDLLGGARALVVLTKRDLVDAAALDEAASAARAALAGTFAEGAQVFAVSTLSGEGMDELRRGIHTALRALPSRPADAPAFLPVDRVFALDGHGTVVTGTLVQGSLATGDTLRIDPPGREVRVRSLQVFGTARPRVDAGARVAVNLPNIDVADTHRGAVLADGGFASRDALQVRFRALPDALGRLRRRTPVRAAIGAAEILGTLIFDGAPPAGAAPADATLHLRRPAVTYPGEAFVVRAQASKELLGGGTIGAPAAAPEGAGDADPADMVAVLRVLAECGAQPCTAAEAGARANVREERAAVILAELAAAGRARALQRPAAFLDGAAAEALSARIAETLAAHEREAPWMMGITTLGLARVLGLDEQFLARFLTAEADDGRVASRAGWYATPAHVPRLTAEQRAFFERSVPVREDGPLLPAALDEVAAALRSERIPGLSQAFDTLVATGALVKVGADVYRGTQIAAIRAKLEDAIRSEDTITMARFRDAVGTSRKYAVPLMEWFDAAGVTIRDGDLRRLRTR